MCVFDPLPFQLLEGQRSFKRLFTIEEARELLKDFKLDFFCKIPFNLQFSKLSPEEFMCSFIKPHFDPLCIVVGYDFSFAHQKAGDFAMLRSFGQKYDFFTEQVPAYLHKGKPVSSSRIRQCLALGQMGELKLLLGRSFSIQAPVIKGKGRGRTLGFPTANFKVKQKELPAPGVYAGKVQVKGLKYKTVMNIGCQPSFGSKKFLLEAHIIDFDTPIKEKFKLYGQNLTLELDFFIRKTRAFSKISDLKSAIKRDIQKALELYDL